MGETVCRCATIRRPGRYVEASNAASRGSKLAERVAPHGERLMAGDLEGMVCDDGDDSEVAIFVIPMVVRCGARTVSWRGP